MGARTRRFLAASGTCLVGAALFSVSSGALGGAAVAHAVDASPGQLHTAADFADVLGEGRWAQTYGGVIERPSEGVLDLYLTSRDAAGETQVASHLPPGALRVTLVDRALTAVRSVQDQVTEDIQQLEKAGDGVVSAAPDFEMNKLVIGVANASPQVTGDLARRYGADNIYVREEVGTQFATRANDVSPWNGGDFITDDGETNPYTGQVVGQDCTSGPPMRGGNGSPYLITAGHCFLLNATVHNRSGSLNLGSDTIMGKVTAVRYPTTSNTTGHDAEVVNTTNNGGSSSLDWEGSPTSGWATKQISAITVHVGDVVCTSGAFDGEICGNSVTNVGATAYNTDPWSGYTFAYTDEDRAAHNVDLSQPAAGEGDSGGPVYVNTSSGLQIEGTIHGAGGSTVPCTYPPTNRTCTDAVYFQDINATLADFGGTLKTS